MKNKKGVPLSYTNNISYKSVIIYGTNEELKANTDYFLMSSKYDLFDNLVLAYNNKGKDRTKRIIKFYLEIGISLVDMVLETDNYFKWRYTTSNNNTEEVLGLVLDFCDTSQLLGKLA